MKNNIEICRTFYNKYGRWQYVAPYRYCFFDVDGKCLGRIIWANNTDGIYIDKCDNEWGL